MTLKTKIAKAIGTIALCAALILPPCLAYSAEKKDRLNANITTSLLNKYVALNGPTMVDGPVNQTTIGIDNNRFLSYVWVNYDLNNRKPTEIDFSTKLKLPQINNFSSTVGYELWTYPQTEPYSMDPAGVLSIAYSGAIDADLIVKKLLTSEADDGYQITSNISKPFELCPGVFFTPGVSTAFLDDFFGGNGFSYIRTGGSFNANLPKGFSLGGSAFYQMSLDDRISENTPILELRLGKSF